MKRIIIIAVTMGVVGLMAYKLYANKEEMAENAKLAEVSTSSIPVEITAAKFESANRMVSADGTFQAATDLTIISETQGKTVRVVREKGAVVRKGELLAQVENDVLSAQVNAARANLQKLQTDSARFTKLSESEAVTQRQLEEVKIGLLNARAQYRQAAKQLSNTYIRATTSGVINDDFVQEGAYISPGARLYEIVDVSKLKLNVRLTAEEVLNVNEGDEVNITSSVYPDAEFTGTVTAIAAKADGALKYNVEITLSNKGGKTLKPGMYASAHFDFKSAQQQLWLNRNAVIGSIQNPQVFVVRDGQSELTNIKIGEVQGEMVQVLSGISPEDQVVLTGHINLENGTVVSILNQD